MLSESKSSVDDLTKEKNPQRLSETPCMCIPRTLLCKTQTFSPAQIPRITSSATRPYKPTAMLMKLTEQFFSAPSLCVDRFRQTLRLY